MVLHPASLKGGVCRLSAKMMSFLVSVRGGVNHRSAQNVNVGHGDGLHLAGSISRPPMRNDSELHDGHDDSPDPNTIKGISGFLVAATIGQAVGRIPCVHGPALATEERLRPAARSGGRPTIGFF